ncbi:Alanine racemase, partial [hydrothermal vent metagenome]
PAHSHNQMQLKAFHTLIDLFPAIPASLSNSAGILLGPEYHFNLTRPGIGLYGGSPFDPEMDPPKLSPVARLLAPILQIRRLQKGQQVGYGARFSAPTDMQIATIAYGYADGLSRTIGANSFGWIDGQKLPLLGRVSMDLMAVDISQLAKCPKPGDFVQFFGDDLNDFASSCATEPYEILTSIGPRVKRVAQEQNK